MRSRRTKQFLRLYVALPVEVRRDAQQAYEDFRSDPFSSSLEFKEIKLRDNKSIWSARTSLGYRVVGTRPESNVIVWAWIGSHANYEKLIERKRKERGALS